MGYQRIGVIFSQDAAAESEALLVQGERSAHVSHAAEQQGKVVHRHKRVGIFLAEHTLARLQNVFAQRQRLLQIALAKQQKCDIVERRDSVRVIGAESALALREKLLVQRERAIVGTPAFKLTSLMIQQLQGIRLVVRVVAERALKACEAFCQGMSSG